MPSDLAAILTRLRLQPADLATPTASAAGQMELLLARISALTDALRDDATAGADASGTARAGDDFQVAARLLLADLALVAAQLRGQTNALADSLNAALEGLQAALDDSSAE
jgi:hypothetical protein